MFLSPRMESQCDVAAPCARWLQVGTLAAAALVLQLAASSPQGMINGASVIGPRGGTDRFGTRPKTTAPPGSYSSVRRGISATSAIRWEFWDDIAAIIGQHGYQLAAKVYALYFHHHLGASYLQMSGICNDCNGLPRPFNPRQHPADVDCCRGLLDGSRPANAAPEWSASAIRLRFLDRRSVDFKFTDCGLAAIAFLHGKYDA
jgi:hypothetical protein